MSHPNDSQLGFCSRRYTENFGFPTRGSNPCSIIYRMITVTLLITSVLSYVTYKFLQWHRKRIDLPCPAGNLILGNALQLDLSKPHQTISKWAKTCGSIFKMRLLNQEIVIVNSLAGCTEMLVTRSEDFAGRPWIYRADFILPGPDIALQDICPRWNLMKRICMTSLKQIGDQLHELEAMTLTVMEDLVQKMLKYDGKQVNIRQDLFMAIQDISFLLIFGKRVSADDHKEYDDLSKGALQQTGPMAKNLELEVFPFLRFPWYKKFKDLQHTTDRINQFYQRHLEKCQKDFDGTNIKCVIDGFIQELNSKSKDGKPSLLQKENISAAALDLMFAGAVTTNAAMYHLIAILATHPNYQETAFSKITEVLHNCKPSVKDRLKIPYIDSMIFEVLRHMSHVPIGNPHKTMKDTYLQGCFIPAGTQVWPNLWHLHHDEDLWEYPWEFKADRFLDSKGMLLTADHQLRKQFLAFGAGRRVCAGEAMAKNRMFLLTVILIQNFEFSVPKDSHIDTDPNNFELGFALTPRDYEVLVKVRKWT